MAQWHPVYTPQYTQIYVCSYMYMYMNMYLLHGKYLMVEVLLKLFVGKIDTELLKTVCLEILKPKNVQNT